MNIVDIFFLPRERERESLIFICENKYLQNLCSGRVADVDIIFGGGSRGVLYNCRIVGTVALCEFRKSEVGDTRTTCRRPLPQRGCPRTNAFWHCQQEIPAQKLFLFLRVCYFLPEN